MVKCCRMQTGPTMRTNNLFHVSQKQNSEVKFIYLTQKFITHLTWHLASYDRISDISNFLCCQDTHGPPQNSWVSFSTVKRRTELENYSAPFEAIIYSHIWFNFLKHLHQKHCQRDWIHKPKTHSQLIPLVKLSLLYFLDLISSLPTGTKNNKKQQTTAKNNKNNKKKNNTARLSAGQSVWMTSTSKALRVQLLRKGLRLGPLARPTTPSFEQALGHLRLEGSEDTISDSIFT